MKKTYTSAFKAKLVLELLKGEKSLSQLASDYKVHPNLLRNWRDQTLHDLASLFDKKNLTADLQASHDRQLEDLFAQIGRLTTQVNWLKKNLASTLTRDERRQLIERQGNDVSLSEQAQLLGLSRAHLYYQKVPPSAEEVRLKHRIDELYTDYPLKAGADGRTKRTTPEPRMTDGNRLRAAPGSQPSGRFDDGVLCEDNVGIEQANFAPRRVLIELLIDCVVVTNEEVEIRYVVPTSVNRSRQPFRHLRIDYRRSVHKGVRHAAPSGAGIATLC